MIAEPATAGDRAVQAPNAGRGPGPFAGMVGGRLAQISGFVSRIMSAVTASFGGTPSYSTR